MGKIKNSDIKPPEKRMQVPEGSRCCLICRKSTMFLNQSLTGLVPERYIKGLTRKTNGPGFMFPHIQRYFPYPPDSIDLDVLWAETLWQRIALVVFHSFHKHPLHPSSELGIKEGSEVGRAMLQDANSQIPDRMKSACTALCASSWVH